MPGADPLAPALERPVPDRSRSLDALVAGLPVLFCVVYLIRGAGFLLDDWYYLRNATFDGLGGVVAYGGDRPVGRLVYTLFYGVFGAHPLPMLLVMAAMAGASAVLFRRLLLRFVPAGVATVATLGWVIVPSHLSLEVWAAVAQAGLAQLCALVVLNVAAAEHRSRGQVTAAMVLTVTAIWSYEAVVVGLLPGVLLVQWCARRRVDVGFTLRVGAAAAVAGGWTFLNWNADREAIERTPDLSLVVPANFAWPFTTNSLAGDLLAIAVMALVGVVFALAILRPETRDPSTTGIVGVGMIFLVLGTTPYLRYLYEPLGAGDRSNFVSAFGAAMVLAGLGNVVWRRRKAVAVGAGVVLLLLALDVRWYRTGLWSEAAADADRVAEAVAERARPGETVIVGPRLVIVDNITPFADGSTIRGAVQLRRGTLDVDADMVFTTEAFESYPAEQRFDQRAVAQLEDHER